MDIHWADGCLSEAVIASPLGGQCSVRYGRSEIQLDTEVGGTYVLVPDGEDLKLKK